MKDMTAILYKLIFTVLIVSFFTMVLGAYTFWQSFLLSLLITVSLYIVGDMLVLPTMGNWMATVLDAGTATIIAWLIPFITALPDIAILGALMIGIAIGIAEYFFHQYLLREKFAERNIGTP